MAYSQVLTEPVIGKLSTNCDEKCIEVKQDTICKVTKMEKTIEKQEREEKKKLDGLDIATKGFKIFSKSVTDFDLQTYTPEVYRDRLIEKIENAQKAGHLTEDQSKETQEPGPENSASSKTTEEPATEEGTQSENSSLIE